MKRIIILLTFLAFGFSQNSKAQENGTGGFELGIRFGSSFNTGGALDAMIPLSSKRLHANLGLYRNGFSAAGVLNFQKSLGEGFNLYYGPGLVVGSHKYSGKNEKSYNYLGICGEIGVEYPIQSAPFTLGLDFRPTFVLSEFSGFEFGFFGFNVRYRFN